MFVAVGQARRMERCPGQYLEHLCKLFATTGGQEVAGKQPEYSHSPWQPCSIQYLKTMLHIMGLNSSSGVLAERVGGCNLRLGDVKVEKGWARLCQGLSKRSSQSEVRFSAQVPYTLRTYVLLKR